MDVVCLGEALIDFVALEAGVSVAYASGFVKAPGGAPANVAVGVSRLGARSAFIGKVGDDPFGLHLRDTLADNGVEIRGMRFDASARTGLAFVSLQADGERDFCFFRNPSADMRLLPEELDLGLIGEAQAFHFGSISLIAEPARSATSTAAREARRGGALVSYDPNLRPPLWPDLQTARRAILDAMSLADVVKVSEDEVRFLTGESDVLTGLDRLMREHGNLDLAVATLGAEGCAWMSRSGGSGVVPGFTVNAVDTTGAGDCFVAGMLVRLLKLPGPGRGIDRLPRADLGSVLRYANAVGALATTKKGAIPALPFANEVERFLKSAHQ